MAANADLIVRAVNSLQSSIAAMEAALEYIGESEGVRTQWIVGKLRDAIKLAKGDTNV